MSTRKPTVYLLCGLPAAGKTTLAKQLEEKQGAVRFTLDEWMIRLYDYTIFDREYGEYGRRCRELIWQTAVNVLKQGVDVVLDWNQWSSKRRQAILKRIEAIGANHQLIYLNIPPMVARERLQTYQATNYQHVISVAEFDRFWPFFEPPTVSEGLNIVEIKYRRENGGQAAVKNNPSFMLTTPAQKTYPMVLN